MTYNFYNNKKPKLTLREHITKLLNNIKTLRTFVREKFLLSLICFSSLCLILLGFNWAYIALYGCINGSDILYIIHKLSIVCPIYILLSSKLIFIISNNKDYKILSALDKITLGNFLYCVTISWLFLYFEIYPLLLNSILIFLSYFPINISKLFVEIISMHSLTKSLANEISTITFPSKMRSIFPLIKTNSSLDALVYYKNQNLAWRTMFRVKPLDYKQEWKIINVKLELVNPNSLIVRNPVIISKSIFSSALSGNRDLWFVSKDKIHFYCIWNDKKAKFVLLDLSLVFDKNSLANSINKACFLKASNKNFLLEYMPSNINFSIEQILSKNAIEKEYLYNNVSSSLSIKSEKKYLESNINSFNNINLKDPNANALICLFNRYDMTFSTNLRVNMVNNIIYNNPNINDLSRENISSDLLGSAEVLGSFEGYDTEQALSVLNPAQSSGSLVPANSMANSNFDFYNNNYYLNSGNLESSYGYYPSDNSEMTNRVDIEESIYDEPNLASLGESSVNPAQNAFRQTPIHNSVQTTDLSLDNINDTDNSYLYPNNINSSSLSYSYGFNNLPFNSDYDNYNIEQYRGIDDTNNNINSTVVRPSEKSLGKRIASSAFNTQQEESSKRSQDTTIGLIVRQSSKAGFKPSENTLTYLEKGIELLEKNKGKKMTWSEVRYSGQLTQDELIKIQIAIREATIRNPVSAAAKLLNKNFYGVYISDLLIDSLKEPLLGSSYIPKDPSYNIIRQTIEYIQSFNPKIQPNFASPFEWGRTPNNGYFIKLVDKSGFKFSWCSKKVGRWEVGQSGSVYYASHPKSLSPVNIVLLDPNRQINRGWSTTESNQPLASNLADILLSVRYNGSANITKALYDYDEALKNFIEKAYNSNPKKNVEFNYISLGTKVQDKNISNSFIKTLIESP